MKIKIQDHGCNSFQILVIVFIVIIIFLIQELIETVELLLLSTVQVVPPITNKILLIKNSSVGTEEACAATIRFTHVEHLALSLEVSVDTGELLLTTAEPCVRNLA